MPIRCKEGHIRLLLVEVVDTSLDEGKQQAYFSTGMSKPNHSPGGERGTMGPTHSGLLGTSSTEVTIKGLDRAN